MELVGLAKEALQTVAETAVSYRIGQVVLRHVDRALWVIEKSARWAVPPALDQDDNPPVELIKPLPWFFFLWLLFILRTARESMSLINLILGKPPVRPADVVMYIQSKRRYLRALKYQGNRNMRARSNRPQQGQDWLSSVYSLFRLSMCFQRPLDHAANNSCATSNNDDEILIVKKTKRKRVDPGPASPTSDESTMEKLIEKMVDMYGDSSDDSEYTLTNATSIKSDTSETSDEDGDAAKDRTLTEQGITSFSTPLKPGTPTLDVDCSHIQEESMVQSPTLDEVKGASLESATEASELLKSSPPNEQKSPTKKTKIANGQAPQSSPSNKKGSPKRRDSEVPTVKITPADDSFNANGQSTEGSYVQNNEIPDGASTMNNEEKSKTTVPNKNSGKSSKANKTKESKIKAPFWKKSKK